MGCIIYHKYDTNRADEYGEFEYNPKDSQFEDFFFNPDTPGVVSTPIDQTPSTDYDSYYGYEGYCGGLDFNDRYGTPGPYGSPGFDIPGFYGSSEFYGSPGMYGGYEDMHDFYHSPGMCYVYDIPVMYDMYGDYDNPAICQIQSSSNHPPATPRNGRLTSRPTSPSNDARSNLVSFPFRLPIITAIRICIYNISHTAAPAQVSVRAIVANSTHPYPLRSLFRMPRTFIYTLPRIKIVVECEEAETEDDSKAQFEPLKEEEETPLVFAGYEEPEHDQDPAEEVFGSAGSCTQ
ncbi:hypothetical protein DPSP01_011309 [Paraphaeosphaeria sporulosa]